MDNKTYWQAVHLSPEAWEAVKAEERLRGQKQTENREARQKKRQEEEAKMWEEKDRKTREAGRLVVAVIRDNEGDSETPLCGRCYDRYYTICTDCGRAIHQDDAYYIDEVSGEARCYSCFCSQSRERVIGGSL